MQISRVAKVRGLSKETLKELVAAYSEDRQLGIFGARRVNVLALNLALDRLAP
jgi:potassium-transporting ATPase KdpC subunit